MTDKAALLALADKIEATDEPSRELDAEIARAPMREGDIVTIAGLYKTVPNPNRAWWQFWKPRMVQSDELQPLVLGKPTQ